MNLIKSITSVLAFFLLVPLSIIMAADNPYLSSKAFSNAVNRLRSRSGKTITCSPDGEKNTILPDNAVKKLKSGMVLHFLPGKYPENLKFVFKNLKNVTIEGDPVFIASWIEIKFEECKNVVIRNLCGHFSINCGSNSSVVVVDSNLFAFGIWEAEAELYNSMVNSFSAGWLGVVKIINCNFRTMILSEAKKMKIEQSLIVGNASFNRNTDFKNTICFRLNKDKKTKIELIKCLVHSVGDIGMEIPEEDLWSDKVLIANGIASLKDMRKLIKSRSCDERTPVFENPSKYDYRLKKDSPGIGWGACLNVSGFPIIPKK